MQAPCLKPLGIIIFTGLAAFVTHLTAAEEKPGTFYGGKTTEYPSWFKESFLDFEEDVAEAGEVGKRVLLLWYQDGCPYCYALVQRNLAQKDIEAKIRKYFDVIALNLWGDRELTVDGKTYTEKKFAEALKVQFTPTLIFLNEQGNSILRLNGYLPPRHFTVALDYVALHKEKEIRYRDYVAAKVPPGKKGSLIKEGFFSPPPHNLRKKPQLTAVYFEQKDCPNCKILHTRVLTDKNTRKLVTHFQNIQLDMWSKQPIVTPSGEKTTARDWAKALDIKYAPTIVFFNQKGKEVIRSEAFFKVFHAQSMFDYVYSNSYQKQPSFQRYISNRAEALIKQGKDVDIWIGADRRK